MAGAYSRESIEAVSTHTTSIPANAEQARIKAQVGESNLENS